jgi:hypothetical protein
MARSSTTVSPLMSSAERSLWHDTIATTAPNKAIRNIETPHLAAPGDA